MRASPVAESASQLHRWWTRVVVTPDSDHLAQLRRDAEGLADEVERLAAAEAADRETLRQAGRDRIAALSQDGWRLLSVVVWALQHSAGELVPRVGDVRDEYTPMRVALSLVHCNGALIVQEIEVLLRNGFWSGAAARWRALHELAVTARLLQRGGPEIAQRYFDHSAVVQIRRLVDPHGAPLPGPIPPDELRRRWSESRVTVERYTTPESKRRFDDAYEWAAPLIPRTASGKGPRLTFAELERLVELDKWRPLFHTANGLVHADSGGVAAAVLRNELESTVGPTEDWVTTVARPTFLTTQQLVAVTLRYFEPRSNDFTEISNAWLFALLELPDRGADAFPTIYA